MTNTTDNFLDAAIAEHTTSPEEPKSHFEVEPKQATITSNTAQIQDGRVNKTRELSPLEKIKNVAITLENPDAEEVQFIVDQFRRVQNPKINRKDFEVATETEELSKAYYDRDKRDPAEPGSLSNTSFEISEDQSEASDSFTAGDVIRVQNVKETARKTIAQSVNFDMIEELKTRVWHSKYELDKYRDIKDANIQSLEESLDKAQEILEVERTRIVTSNLEAILENLERIKVEGIHPDARSALWEAIHQIKCAKDLVNKAGFKTTPTENEKLVTEYITKAIGLWPELRNDSRMDSMITQILNLENE